jgi:hypothetical protein
MRPQPDARWGTTLSVQVRLGRQPAPSPGLAMRVAEGKDTCDETSYVVFSLFRLRRSRPERPLLSYEVDEPDRPLEVS